MHINWLSILKADPLPWLLEADDENPGVRFFALTDILERGMDDPEVVQARNDIMSGGPVPAILNAQDPQGFWVESGPGYNPKYRATVWQIIFLAQLGADGSHPAVQAGCRYVLENSRSRWGRFSTTALPSGTIHCLEGNLCAALIDLDWLGDPRLEDALEWLARSVTGEGISSEEQGLDGRRYLRSGNSGPGFLCSANDHLPCAWGAVKAMLGLSRVPPSNRSIQMRKALETGADFLLSNDPAAADYPMGYSTKPNRSWFRFGYPIGYVTDVLQNLEVLTLLGYGDDERLRPALELVVSKQDDLGRWRMEYTYNGKTWVDVEEKNKPSKWVTLRALRVLKRASEAFTSLRDNDQKGQ